jgi:protocatechuate 4,5-dioxygenase, alpha chain
MEMTAQHAPVVFNMELADKGFWINRFCMGLMDAANREAFKRDEAGYLARFPLSSGQTQAILARDYNRCIAMGGNIYFLVKLGATDGVTVQAMCAGMAGMPVEDYRNAMLAGGRFNPAKGN